MLVMEGHEKEKSHGSRVDSKSEKGKYIKSKYSSKVTSSDIVLDATLRTTTIRSNKNINNNNNLSADSNKNNGLKVNIQDVDIREKICKHKVRDSMSIVVDMSGPMMSEKKVNMIRNF